MLIRLSAKISCVAVLLAAVSASAAEAPASAKPAEAKAPAAVVPGPATPVTWKKITLSDKFFSEGAGVGDFNHDGKPDIVSGPYWYEGPDFSPERRHTYYEPKAFEPHGYSENFFAYSYDFNGDGWDDILILGFPGKDASWFENPKTNDGTWAQHKIVDVVDNESPTFADVNGDGKPDILCTQEGHLGYATAPWKDAAKPWTFHPVPRPEGPWQKFTHGLGYGDINGDGKTDLLMHEGWWQQPDSLANDPEWKFHKADFGGGGAQMFAYDVNGDGRSDVITSLAAHGYGLAWFEQNADGSFNKHLIMGDKPDNFPHGVAFSQLHALELIDIDGDGLKDIVTGKHWWAHAGGDPGVNKPAVSYWFQLVRKDGKAQFIPHLIDGDSGVGTQVTVADVNGDKRPDIVVGNKKGTFVILQERN